MVGQENVFKNIGITNVNTDIYEYVENVSGVPKHQLVQCQLDQFYYSQVQFV